MSVKKAIKKINVFSEELDLRFRVCPSKWFLQSSQ